MAPREVRLEAGEQPPSPTGVRFGEAVEWFRARVPMTRDRWDELEATNRHRAFTVSGVAQLDLVNDTMKALDRAVEAGTTLEEFKKEIGEKLQREWAGTVANPAARLETIFRTNVQSAYAAGRWHQATDPVVLEARPFWKFVAVLDLRTTSICRPLNGKVVEAGDAWWKSHLPPLHFNCRSTFSTLTPDEAEKAGITRKPPDVKPMEGFGQTPDVEWQPDPAKYDSALRTEAEKKGTVERDLKPGENDEKIARYVDAGSLSEADAKHVIDSIRIPAVRDFLRTSPLAKVSFPREILGDPSINGYYEAAEIEVRGFRPPSSFGVLREPNYPPTFSKTAKTEIEAISISYAHEVGHHLYRKGPEAVRAVVADAYAAKSTAGIEGQDGSAEVVSQRALVNPREYLSECFAAYTADKSYLKRADPAGYKMVRKVLGLLRR